ncbi:MAG: type II toxin-antitoxin system RelE/ParE family toxin [Terracidiphilus sp.]
MRLRLSKYVSGDLEEIADYIAQDSPRNAIRLIRLLRQRMQEIAKQPQLYQLRPEIGHDARLAILGNYVILFRILNNSVRVERVLHGSRDLFPISAEFELTEIEN